MQQYHYHANKARREVQSEKQKENLEERGFYNLKINSSLCNR